MKDCGFPIRITPKIGQHIIEAEIPKAEAGHAIFYDIEGRKPEGIEKFHKWIRPKSLTVQITKSDAQPGFTPPQLIWEATIQYRIPGTPANEGLRTIKMTSPTSQRPLSGRKKASFQGWRIRIFPNYIWSQHKKRIMRETRVRNQIQRI